MAIQKNRFSRTVGLLWLIGSLGYALPCNAGFSPQNTFVVSSRSVLVGTLVIRPFMEMLDSWFPEPMPLDLKHGEGTVCISLPDQGLYQCDSTGTELVSVQIKSSQPVQLGLNPNAVTAVANTIFSGEAARTAIGEIQKGYQRQKEILESTRKTLNFLPSRADLTPTLELILDPEKPDEEERDQSNEEEPIQWWMIDDWDSGSNNEAPYWWKNPNKERPEPDDEALQPIDPDHLELQAQTWFLPKGFYCIKRGGVQKMPPVNSYPHTPDGTSNTDTGSSNEHPSQSDPFENTGESNDVVIVGEDFPLSSELGRQGFDECDFTSASLELFPEVQIKQEPIDTIFFNPVQDSLVDSTVEIAIDTPADALSEPTPIPQIALATYYKAEKHEEGKLTCGIEGCTRWFKYNASPPKHKVKEHGKGILQCGIGGCNRSFKYNASLSKHKVKEHGEGKLQCGIWGCIRRFMNRTSLARHKARKHAKGEYQCDIERCTKLFATLSDMNSHKAEKHGQGGDECDIEGCKWRYTQPFRLLSHKAQMHEEGKHQCSVGDCTKQFACTSTLESHKAEKHGEGGKECDFKGCKWRYTLDSRLEHHKIQTHKVGGKECDIEGCKWRYTNPSRLRCHKTKKHRQDEEKQEPKQKKQKLEKQGDETGEQQNSP